MSTALANKSGFNVGVTNMQEAMQMATMMANSQLAPQSFRGRPEDTLVAMMMGNELGLNPMQSIQNIAVINGRPSIWGDAMLALVQNHPAFGGINEKFDTPTMTATCTVWRKGGEKHVQTFSQSDAETAGLWKRKGPWTTSPKRMLALRARGFALRNQFADALCGLISAEEATDIPIEKEINPSSNDQATIKQIEELPTYSQESFDQNFPKWEEFIKAGKKTPEQIISMVNSKAPLTEEMTQQIKAIDMENAA